MTRYDKYGNLTELSDEQRDIKIDSKKVWKNLKKLEKTWKKLLTSDERCDNIIQLSQERQQTVKNLDN